MKRVLFVTLFTIVFALALTIAGCGGGSNSIQATGTSTTVQFGDATNDQIAKFELTVSSITLTGGNGTSNTANLLAAPVEFEFSHTAGMLEPVSLSKVPAGTYTAATISWSNPEVVTIDATGAATKLTATPSSGTANVTFSSAITVGTTPTFLNFDLNLAQSLTISGTSATITPTFTVTSSSVPAAEAGENDEDGEADEVHGKVTVISAPNFTIQTEAGATIQFATNSSTHFNDGITQLSDLKVGDIVEVDSVTQSDGSKLATKVEREGSETGEEAEGLIQNLDNPLTTITIVHQLDSSSAVAPTTVSVSVNSQTQYLIHPDKLNVSGAFDATHIGKGQRIEADADGQGSSIVARKVQLREQALIGTVSNATSSGFTLTPSPTSAFASLSGATSVAVTFAQSVNMQVTPANGATVRVRGIVLVNAGVYTMTATKVDNNQ
jgi:Domain of unknown function (DUF5666)